MMPLVDRLIAEGIPIEKREVWNNQSNTNLMEPLSQNRCPGVPFFMNTESDQWICGSTDEETLRAWAAGKTMEH